MTSESETDLVADNGLAVEQWELALADRLGRGPGDAWPSRKLSAFGSWLAERWDEACAPGAPERELSLLSAGQSDRLWRRVIDESPAGQALIGTQGVARLAAAARRSLHDHGLDPAAEPAAAWPGDAGSFLDWNRRFDRELLAQGWVDPDSLLYRFNRLALRSRPPPLKWLDPAQPLPEQRRIAARWRERGAACDWLHPDGEPARCRGLVAADPGAELGLAAAWVEQRLQADRSLRLAVVVPDLARRLTEVEQAFCDRIGAAGLSVAGGRSIGEIGIFAAAVTAIEALTPGRDFAAISRLLRSPFFAVDDARDRADRLALECWLRSDPRLAGGFVDAYRHYGLRPEFARRAPALARRLDRVLAELPQLATPTAWAEALTLGLRTLGWHGFDSGLPPDLAAAWDQVWSAFAELTAIVGRLALPEAFAEFERILAGQAAHRPLCRAGVHVLSRMDEVGPGYAGAWVTGFSDLAWPEQPMRNPLVPWPVRHRCEMPGTRPQQDLEAAEARLQRLLRRVGEVIFSCPERILDRPQLPNPKIAAWEPGPGPAARAATPNFASRRLGARSWERVDDPAPPLSGASIRGGARTLDLQARNPALAFCTARLFARPLEAPARGLDARLRGILAHRTLEWLGRARLRGEPPDAGLADALTRACAELPHGNAAWQAQITAERARLAALVSQLLALEARRAPFRIEAIEQSALIEIGGRQLQARIDRVDRLATDQHLLIDYKTGRWTPGGWFSARLSDCQLPLYAQHYRASIAAVVVATLHDETVALRAAGSAVADLPGRQRHFGDGDWAGQLERWRTQIEALVAEFAAGDVRVSTALSDREGQAFAALTRIAEFRR